MRMPARDAETFFELQTQTGWGGVLARFCDWISPKAGWLTLDVGCGPGLLPALLSQKGCHSLGIDLDLEMLLPSPLHPHVAAADAMHLPFPSRSFNLITASNLLFLLPDPQETLRALTRLLRSHGQIATLNPSEHLTVISATELADKRNLTGLPRESLLNWAARAEIYFHWTETETDHLFASVDLEMTETHTTMGPGFARFARGIKI
jgi:ubiquinone/menaquinone biosynthesis C-methylase UbiE